MAEQRLTGKVYKTVRTPKGGFGFIRTPEKRKFFFHKGECPGDVLPDPGTVVSFVPVKQKDEESNDRAVRIEIVSAAA